MSTTVTNYSGTVYDFGDEIPGYVEFTYKPKIWYDQSKSVNGGTWDIFSELGISESLILGDTEDDLWTYEEILDEICRYFNLHIVQLGYDFYIFDWETSKSGNSVEWVDILTGNTQQKSYSTITVTKSMYSDDSTQITMGDVYNQIVLEDNIEEYDDIILSPFDDVVDIASKQIYMTEYWATGQGERARNAFKDLLNGVSTGTTYGDGDGAYIKNWWFKTQKPKYWKFSTSTWGDNYSRIPVDANGRYYQQWKLAQWVDQCPWASGMFCWGHGDKSNRFNLEDENIEPKDKYIVINVQGNGCDKYTGGTIYPTDADLLNKFTIEYTNNEDGVYSSADPSIHNYIVFNGKIKLTTAHERTGGQGFLFDLQDQWNYKVVNEWTKKTQAHEQGYHYVDNEAFKRKLNNFSNAKTVANGNEVNTIFKYRTVGSDDNDDGRFYTDMFYEQWYPGDEDLRPSETNTYLAPPCAEGDLSKRFKYDLENNKSYYWNGDPTKPADVVPYVDVLACTLQIGDKYCCETPDIDEYNRAKKKYVWLTEEEIQADPERYMLAEDGSVMYDQYVYLAVRVKNGEWVIGESHDIFNNITSDMYIEGTGQAIPLPYEAHLSGKLKFAIVGVVNQEWQNGLRRHKTWFRHTTMSSMYVPIMSHVDKIYIENLKFDFKSDYGMVADKGNDIIYMSDEIKKYVNKKDDIEFKFNTSLTAEEAEQMGTIPFSARSAVIDMTTGGPIVNIVNNVTSETDKPERFYVDAYYREYNQPRMIVDTSFNDQNQVVNFNKYTFPYLENKTFFVVKTEKDVKREKINLTLKERND